MLFIIIIVFMIASLVVSTRLKNKFKKYSKIPLSTGLTGKEIAQLMLADHGIHDVTVTSVQGQLTDHYNPANKTVNLSPDVYNGRSAAAAAVAAHECGHAVQHDKVKRSFSDHPAHIHFLSRLKFDIAQINRRSKTQENRKEHANYECSNVHVIL